MTGELEHLAELIRAKNEADLSIARLLGRQALSGNIGEFVAARVFGIDLMPSGSHAGYDGVFCAPPPAGQTVNIKTYSRNEWILDIGKHPCDYYLVLTGPRAGPCAAGHRLRVTPVAAVLIEAAGRAEFRGNGSCQLGESPAVRLLPAHITLRSYRRMAPILLV